MGIQQEALEGFGRAVARFDQAGGAAALIEALRLVVPFQSAVSVVFRPDARPVYVHDTFREASAKEAMERFMSSTYVLNPIYGAVRGGLAPGVYRMRDLVPDAYFDSDLHRHLEVRRTAREELGYITHGWPEGLEELVIAIGLPGGCVGEIGLARPRSTGFDDDCVAAVRLVFPLVAAIFARLWSTLEKPLVRSEADFDAGVLTPREREVALMILKGHSGESIALNLGLSLATVKTHRQRLYAKLGISSQGELFACFMARNGR
ncbi:MAG: LuxR family transcriptional regulator [Alphaproteobacteria bacterium]|nr:LuxR family transcriptional regulator [Alphaproteobacteria bacterium]